MGPLCKEPHPIQWSKRHQACPTLPDFDEKQRFWTRWGDGHARVCQADRHTALENGDSLAPNTFHRHFYKLFKFCSLNLCWSYLLPQPRHFNMSHNPWINSPSRKATKEWTLSSAQPVLQSQAMHSQSAKKNSLSGVGATWWRTSWSVDPLIQKMPSLKSPTPACIDPLIRTAGEEISRSPCPHVQTGMVSRAFVSGAHKQCVSDDAHPMWFTRWQLFRLTSNPMGKRVDHHST